MILDFTKDLEAIKKHLADKDDDWKVVLAIADVFFRGRNEGIEHAVRIVQKRAMSPMPIVQEIRKPVR